MPGVWSGSRWERPLSERDRSASQSDGGVQLEEYLSVVVPHLSRDLVSDVARENLYALGRLLPVTDLAGFELNLDTDDGRVDLITRHPKSRHNVSPHLTTHPVWNSVVRCLRQLSNHAGPLAGSVNVIDLEFDLPCAPAPLPVPGIFLELKRDIELPVERVAMLASQILDISLPDWMNASLHQCLDALPPKARVIHLGALRSRDVQQLRVVIGRVAPSLLTRYLEGVGWAGDCPRLENVIDAVASLVDSMTLSLDVGRQVGDRVGIECFLRTAGDDTGRWSTLLGRLQHEHLCTEAKARALLAWPGTCQEGMCGAPWPPSLVWGDALLRGTAVSVFGRFLSHVKLVSRPRAPLSAKGYVGFTHYWLEGDPSSLRGGLP